MPFGKKVDPKSAQEIDFDAIYETGIRPAIEGAGLSAIRGDQETTGGIIHKAMFARLLLSEFVVADMTTANANVFYELGVRHTAKPQTTIPIFATLSAPPFDVNMIRAIPYDLENGILTDTAAADLIVAIGKRIKSALEGPVSEDSPLFSLFPQFPGIEMSHELTDVFRDRVEYAQKLKTELANARSKKPLKAAVTALGEIAERLGDTLLLERGVLIDLFLSYRAVEAYDEMISLYERMPAETRAAALSRQQLALALNRRNEEGDRDKAISTIQLLIDEQGTSAESQGILGRVYKDKYQDAKAAGARQAAGLLDLAIEAYADGFEAEPSDFYPGVNAITLLLQKGDEEAEAQIEHLAPLVTFAAVRRGGERSNDYWTVATVLELAAVSGDYPLATRSLNRALALPDTEGWMFKTTCNNLKLILDMRPEDADELGSLISGLEDVAADEA